MPGWTRETMTALAEADWAYTREWHQAMRAYSAPTLREVMDRYNAVMPAATQRWKDAYAAAVALSEDPF